MNRRYIDFVPVKKEEVEAASRVSGGGVSGGVGGSAGGASRGVGGGVSRAVGGAHGASGGPEVDDFAVAEIFEERQTPVGVTRSRTTVVKSGVSRGVAEANRASQSAVSGVSRGPRLTADVFKVAKRPVKTPGSALGANRGGQSVAGSAARTNNDVARVRRTEVQATETVVEVPQKRAQLGVIEDLGPRFVNTEVEKRPLGASASREGATDEVSADASAYESSEKTGVKPSRKQARELKEAKAEKLTGGRVIRRKMSVGEGAMTSAASQTVKSDKGTMGIPKFVNTEKVDKRPLSKNVYAKKAVATREEPKGPVTIISKPERDSQVGMVIAIIITIILGATAGTVAFLLLPK